MTVLSISWQTIGQANPRQSVVNPSVVSRRHCRGLVKAANGNIDLICVTLSNECQWCAALRTERTQPLSPTQLSRLSGGEPKLAPTPCYPRHERCAATPTAIQTVAVSDVVRFSGRLITHRTTQTTAANCLWIHGYEMPERHRGVQCICIVVFWRRAISNGEGRCRPRPQAR